MFLVFWKKKKKIGSFSFFFFFSHLQCPNALQRSLTTMLSGVMWLLPSLAVKVTVTAVCG